LRNSTISGTLTGGEQSAKMSQVSVFRKGRSFMPMRASREGIQAEAVVLSEAPVTSFFCERSLISSKEKETPVFRSCSPPTRRSAAGANLPLPSSQRSDSPAKTPPPSQGLLRVSPL